MIQQEFQDFVVKSLKEHSQKFQQQESFQAFMMDFVKEQRITNHDLAEFVERVRVELTQEIRDLETRMAQEIEHVTAQIKQERESNRYYADTSIKAHEQRYHLTA